MSTPEEQLRRALGLAEEEPPATPSSLPALPGDLPPSYDLRQALGIANEDEVEDANIIQSFFAGATTGVSEPLTMIPFFREKMEFMEQYKGDDLRDKIAYGLGWMAGGFIPGAAAFKIGSVGARALKLAKAAENAGDAVTELTRAGKLVRGGIAGAAWSVGQEAEDVEGWAKNIAMNAAMFGVGDLAIDSGLRALSKWYKKGRGTPPPQDLIDAVRAASTSGADETQSALMGRALGVIDDIIERETGSALTMEGMDARRLKMQLGVEQLGLEEVRDGFMKIIPSIGGDIKDITGVIEGLGDFRYRTITRAGRGGKKVTDVLVGRRGEFDDRIAREFNKNGWVEGMEVIWRGKKRVVMSGTKDPNILMGFSVDNPTRKLHPIRRDEMHVLPILQPPAKTLQDPNRWWARFTQRRGEFPEEGFEKAFRDFTEENAIFGVTRERLKLHFLRRQRDALRAIDPELSGALETVGKASAVTLRNTHPEGSFNALAAEKGFLVEWAPKEAGDGFDIILRNQKNGTSTRHLSREGAEDFLKSYMNDPGEMIPGMDSPIGMGAVAAAQGGVGVVPAHSALEASNFRSPLLFTATSRILPREAFIRRSEDLLRSQGITHIQYRTPQDELKSVSINLWGGNEGIGGFMNIRQGQIRVRNELFGKYAPEGIPVRDWMGDIIKMRGGKRDLKTIRPEKLDAWWEVFEQPRSKHAAAAKKAGLNGLEIELVGRARSYMDDLFKRIMPHVDAENIVDGDQFVEQYLPYFRRMSSARWGAALDDTLTKQGKKLNKAIENLLDDAYNTGEIGKHERDPFTVMARLTDYGFKKVHVERHYKATQDMLNKMSAGLQQMPRDSEAFRSLELVHRSMVEYMNLTRGGAPEVHQALNVTVKNLFDQLDIKVSDVAFDRMINTMVSINYGAFMGFRLGQPIRNLTQMLFGTLPRVGSSNLSRGIEAALRNPSAAKKEVLEAGAIVERGIGLAMDDVVLTKQIRGVAEGSGVTGRALKIGERLEDLSNFSLGGKIRIGNKEIPVGLFNFSDEFNRIVSYFAQKHKTIKAINGWKTKGWSVSKFNEEAGLTQFGEAVSSEFHRRMTVNQDDAIKFISALLSDDTQFMYQLGAGPAWMAHGVGRLIGQYGTWPAWYGELLRKGSTQGTIKDKIRFVGWTAAAHAAIISAGYATGLNLSRWTGLSSFGWAGGPFFDWAKDATSIWGGMKQDGTPTAARQMALGSYGLEDVGPAGGVVGGITGSLPGGPTQIRMEDPYKFFESTVGMFTPGMYAIRDAMNTAKAFNDGRAGEAIINAMGLRKATTVGNTYPEINFTR